jgi:hypothetical protein
MTLSVNADFSYFRHNHNKICLCKFCVHKVYVRNSEVRNSIVRYKSKWSLRKNSFIL